MAVNQAYEDRRLVYLASAEDGEPFPFRDLKKGMRFILYEGTGEPVGNPQTEWPFVAASDAYPLPSGVWTVEIEGTASNCPINSPKS